ncbi:MAG TPA: metallophosphoesterase family protein [Candidatus Limnocylindria bacterium]|nr:metallophosphoesterase family protein [Candidatus Limnocylindria bacterium]
MARVAVLADLHANLPALRAVFADLTSIDCQEAWCLGDVVGRGPHPDEVVDELRRLQIPTVQGNWDEAVGMDRDETGTAWGSAEHEAAGLASLRWTASRMRDENRAWLRQLPTSLRLAVEGRSALLVHGSPLRSSDYLWRDRPTRDFARVASDEGDDIICFGHTHETFHRVLGTVNFVSAGSVGCGETGDARARYAVLDVTEDGVEVSFRGVEYDHAPVMADLRAAGLAVEVLAEPPRPHSPVGVAS